MIVPGSPALRNRLLGLLVGLGVAHAVAAQSSPPAASQPGGASPPASAPVCRYGDPTVVCEIRDERIVEASGLAASRRHPGLYYTHNDSGGAAEVYLVGDDGRTRLTIVLDGAENVDWEDIAIAPGQAGDRDVCVADIGDNKARRREIAVYRFPEPATLGSDDGARAPPDHAPGQHPTMRVKPDRFRLRYPDGAYDAESFAVHPQTGDGYILTKTLDGRPRVYKLPAPWAPRESAPGVGHDLIVLTYLGLLQIDAQPAPACLTAADISPDGRRLVARSYVCGWEWRLAEAVPRAEFDRIFRSDPRMIRLASEPQGEAIAYTPDGRALRTISEKRPTRMYEVSCESPRHPDR